MKVEFVTADVFTREPFGGNPVAVIPDGGGLSTEQMQNIAMEFNLSETTFVLPPKDPAHTAEVRIFTPKAEIPFAGHPNIGTAFVLSRLGWPGDRFVFEERAGLVEIDLFLDSAKATGARLTSPQAFHRGESLPVETVAEACSLEPGEIETENHLPCLGSCGMPFVLAEVNSRASLAAAAPRTDVFTQSIPTELSSGILLYTQSETEGVDLDARVFAPLHGVYEDPATGSANVALIGLLAQLATATDLELTKIISQGVYMGRPSVLTAEAVKQAGDVVTTRIGGNCVPMMTGSIAVT